MDKDRWLLRLSGRKSELLKDCGVVEAGDEKEEEGEEERDVENDFGERDMEMSRKG